ncbi:MAG: transposase [Magnetococcales bacterium]|nr:transposase [Magnetococcales bacterium]
MNAHDLGYARLFSHARMIQDLVAGFIHEEWVAGLDFATLEKVNPIYVTDDFRKRVDDLVWKIRWQGTDRWVYIYLILEPQSTVDDIMAVRNALYEMLHPAWKPTAHICAICWWTSIGIRKAN